MPLHHSSEGDGMESRRLSCEHVDRFLNKDGWITVIPANQEAYVPGATGRSRIRPSFGTRGRGRL